MLILPPFNLSGTAGNSAQVQQFFNRLATLPSSSDQTLYAAFINSLVADGTWGQLDACVLCAAANSATSLTELTTGTFTPTLDMGTGTPTFTAYQGWTHFAAASFQDINSNFNPSTAGGHYTQNAATIAAWNLNATQMNCPLWTDNTHNECYPKYSNADLYTQMNDVTEVFFTNSADSSGWYSLNRTASNLYTVKRNNSSLGSHTTTSATLANAKLYFGQGVGGVSQILAAYAIGALSSSQETTLYNATQTYLHAVGAV